MVRDALDRAVNPVVKGPHNSGARHQAHIGQAGKFRHRRIGPSGPRLVAQSKGFGVQAATHAEIFIRQDHPRARPPRRQRRRQARRASADDQDVAVQKALVIGIGVFQPREAAKARRAPDDGFIDFFPKRRRPHEGFVVKARRQKAVETVVDRQRVKLQAGPAVLALRGQPVKQLCHGGAGVGFLPRARAQFDQGVRLFGASRDRPTRAVILKAAPHQADAVGQQGRGECIAGVARIRQPVKMKAKGLAAVDQAACNAVGLAHFERPSARATSRANSTCKISCVTVLRVTTSHERSPCS